MTNQDLDRWIAEKVMGWVESGSPGFEVWTPPGEDHGLFVDSWKPARNVAQAIAAAEKARADGKIAHYSLGSPTPPHLPEFRAAVYFHDRRGNVERRQVDAPTFAIALSRALHGALS